MTDTTDDARASATLIERLRAVANAQHEEGAKRLLLEAANHIEALERRIAELEEGILETMRTLVADMEAQVADGSVRTISWPDPTPETLSDPKFEAVWQAIKTWDINVPGAYCGYCGATGNHVKAILDALATASSRRNLL